MDKRVQAIMNEDGALEMFADMLKFGNDDEAGVDHMFRVATEDMQSYEHIEDPTDEMIVDYCLRHYWDEMIHGYMYDHVDYWRKMQKDGIWGNDYIVDCFLMFDLLSR